MISWKHERFYLKQGIRLIAGVDEAGRGPLAGPVVASAVILPLGARLPRNCFGVDDSKKLSPQEREDLFGSISQTALCIGTGICTHQEIDRINILQATMQAMTDAVTQIQQTLTPEFLLIDGNYFKTSLSYPFKTIVDGDAYSPSIAAASIIAKVTRDRIMQELHWQYPEYNFFNNKGYATKEHRDAIKQFGQSPVHRKSFKLKQEQTEELFEVVS
jgi:ribonuclease HII